MKLLFVIDYLGTGGAQRQMVNLALGLLARGWEIAFFCYAEGMQLANELAAAGIPVIHYKKKFRYSPGVVHALHRVINIGKYDLVLSYLTTPNFYAILTTKLIGHKPPVVVSERFYDPKEGASLTERCIRLFYALADHVTVNSHHQTNNLLRKYPWLNQKTSTIYNGYDLERFSPAAFRPCDPDLNILVIASISPWKNGLCLVRALHILKQEYGLTIKVSWVGEQVKAGERLAYRQQMEQEIEAGGLAADWTWLGQRMDIPDLLRAHDVLVHPSYGEGLPNVVCEALSCGCPVIVSDTLDNPHLVKQGETGFLFDWNSPDSLAQAIKHFNELTLSERQQMGNRARLFAEQNLSQARYVAEYENLFRALLKRRGS